jgi:hypothetical protein
MSLVFAWLLFILLLETNKKTLSNSRGLLLHCLILLFLSLSYDVIRIVRSHWWVAITKMIVNLAQGISKWTNERERCFKRNSYIWTNKMSNKWITSLSPWPKHRRANRIQSLEKDEYIIQHGSTLPHNPLHLSLPPTLEPLRCRRLFVKQFIQGRGILTYLDELTYTAFGLVSISSSLSRRVLKRCRWLSMILGLIISQTMDSRVESNKWMTSLKLLLFMHIETRQKWKLQTKVKGIDVSQQKQKCKSGFNLDRKLTTQKHSRWIELMGPGSRASWQGWRVRRGHDDVSPLLVCYDGWLVAEKVCGGDGGVSAWRIWCWCNRKRLSLGWRQWGGARECAVVVSVDMVVCGEKRMRGRGNGEAEWALACLWFKKRRNRLKWDRNKTRDFQAQISQRGY